MLLYLYRLYNPREVTCFNNEYVVLLPILFSGKTMLDESFSVQKRSESRIDLTAVGSEDEG